MNLFDKNIPEFGENFETLFENKNIKISKIVSSNKIPQKEYNQKENEFVFLLDGEAKLKINNQIKTLKKGEYLYIPAHTPHTLISTSNGALWLAIYFEC